MHEVKFRYWLRDLDTGEIGFEWFTLEQLEGFESLGYSDEWEILARDQWTGRADSNGQDIYENDVLSITIWLRQRLYVILWCGVGFKAVEKEGSNPLMYESWGFAEVVGNVHEKGAK